MSAEFRTAEPIAPPGPVARVGGFAAIGDYAAIGDGRTVALVCRDGSIDWLCAPSVDDPSLLGALLDPAGGGSFALASCEPCAATRRYLPATNVLETTFTTDGGTLRVTDALSTEDGVPLDWTELVRRVECTSGEVALRWRLEPRFDHGRRSPSIAGRRGVVLASGEGLELALLTWDAGEPQLRRTSVEGETTLRAGQRATLALLVFADQPLLLPERANVERRLDGTAGAWRRLAERAAYDGPWRDQVVRSMLALQLLVHEPSGAIVAAPTTSLPEAIGAERNYDYRFAWVRDATFTMDALLRLGYPAQAQRSLSALLRSVGHTHPRVRPIYRLDGRPLEIEEELTLPGYRGSRPVRVGNSAGKQEQLSNYGDLLETVALYVRKGGALDAATGRLLAAVADELCGRWKLPDAGLWELSERDHYTESKMGCWTALDRAVRLAELGEMPREGMARWRTQARAIRDFVDERCWSEEHGAFARSASRRDELNAGVLLVARNGYVAPDDPRMLGTVAAVRRELSDGPFVYRYSGQWESEGAFVACSFWLVEALARAGRRDQAAELMDTMVGRGNDVGLFSEEIDPRSGELLGNFPQSLSHLSLINAAIALEQEPGSVRL